MRPVSSPSPPVCPGLTHPSSSPPTHTCWDCGAQAGSSRLWSRKRKRLLCWPRQGRHPGALPPGPPLLQHMGRARKASAQWL